MPAIVEASMDLVEQQLIVAIADYGGMQKQITRLEGKLVDVREAAKIRRLEIGRLLVRARSAYPDRGPNAKPWGELLKRIGLPESTAKMYMDEYRDPKGFAERSAKTPRSGPEVDDDPDETPGGGSCQPPGPPPAVTEADVLALLDQLDQDARGRIMRSLRSKQGRENEGDRDAYCTPPLITAALPEVDFDPCSNPRSTVRARRSIQLERGENGLEVAWEGSGFWNIPYSKPLPWAEKFARERAAITMAGWLVNEDHSPQWWHLISTTLPIRLDFDERLEFVPPPGVPTSKNDRPQTLLMDAPFWAACDQAALLAMGKLWVRADHAHDFARTTTALRIVR